MHKYIIMGVQGCGKGTQARLLKEAFDLVHISVGDIFRWHIQSHTKLGARIKRIMAAGELVPAALRVVHKGGRVVCGGIHMSDIPAFPYRLLWEERSVVSVANLTRADAREFLDFVQTHPLQVHVRTYPLAQANEALADLRAGRIEGAAVLVP